MALTVVTNQPIEYADKCVSLDPTNPTHLLYAGSAMIGAGVVVTSIGVTTTVAPGLVMVPAVVAAGAAAAGAYINEQRDSELADKSDAESNNAPAPAGA